jgi:diaminopimelate decarboxylase
MTLEKLLPSLRSSLPHPIEPWLWPASTHHLPGGDLSVGGVSLMRIVAEHGSGTQIIDIGEFRARADEFRHAFYGADVSYASKALLTQAVCRWVEDAGLRLDVCSAGELFVARRANFPMERISLHGNAKSTDLLRTAMPAGIGRIIVDSVEEIDQLAELAFGQGRQKIMLRVIPGVDAGTHPAITTGIEGQKFGLSLLDGSVDRAVSKILNHPQLELSGLHCHLGSQISNADPFVRAAGTMVAEMARIQSRFGVTLPELNLGGGFSIAYRGGEVPLSISETAADIRHAVRNVCDRHMVRPPRLAVEPGRSIAGPAGITIYRVVTVKHSGGRRWLMVNGGMADNPRPCLYGAGYTARLLGRLSGANEEHLTIAGQHCESGDVLIADALLPEDIHPGDLLVVPATGAYHHSMSSNYNMTPRQPLIGVENGTVRTLVRRETMSELTRREVADR